jgi:septal ring factor EnvC (AmiA/AmiB activator)
MFSCMTVMAREAWTDERLDDLKENVNQRFDQVDKRFEQVDKRFDEVDKRFDRVEADIRELRVDMKRGFDSMQRTMVIGFVSLFASIAAALIGAAAFA